MYGILLESVQLCVQKEFGDDVWQAILREAGAKSSVFNTHQQYPDTLVLRLATALARQVSAGECAPLDQAAGDPSPAALRGDASPAALHAPCSRGSSLKEERVRQPPKRLDTPEAVLRFFGNGFLEFFTTVGYDTLIRATGRYFCTFLQSLDNLHQRIAFSFPRMRSPSMQLVRAHARGAELVYRTLRQGYAEYLIGLLQGTAKEIFSLQLNVSILRESTEGAYSVVVFRLEFNNTDYVQSLMMKKSIPCSLPSVPATLLLQLFPFGIMLNRQMKVIMAGRKLIRAWGGPLATLLQSSATDLLKLRKPKTAFTWEKVMAMQSVFFELELVRWGTSQATAISLMTTGGAPAAARRGSQGARCILLNGQMRHIEEIDAIVFLCSPIFNNLDELTHAGLYLADLNGHGLSREMLLRGWQHCSRLEMMFERAEDRSGELEKSLRLLDHWKRRGDQLLYSMIPKPIAEHLRAGKDPLAACQAFECVSVVFCAVRGLACGSRARVLDAVSACNEVYSRIDRMLDSHRIYKVETVGDVYMCVSGAPERARAHAAHATAAALCVSRGVRSLGAQVAIGVHSGPCVGCVLGLRLPRYCLVGDTVNTASRMQSSCEPGRVQISAETATLLPPGRFRLRKRGLVKVKGKGMMETFWLEGETDVDESEEALDMVANMHNMALED